MLRSFLHIKTLKRELPFALMGLFVLQLIAASFCITPTSVQASPIPMQYAAMEAGNAGMAAHCEKQTTNLLEQSSTLACAHCDSPKALILSQTASGTFSVDVDILPLMLLQHQEIFTFAISQSLITEPSTAPPFQYRSVYQQTQRIRI